MRRAAVVHQTNAAKGINARRYARLLAQTLPTIIRTEEENERILAAIWTLMKKGEENLSIEELELIELLAVLVEQFEREFYQIEDSPPHRILQHLLDDRNLKPSALLPIFGSRGYISEVVKGKRAVSHAHAKALGQFFDVSADLFL